MENQKRSQLYDGSWNNPLSNGEARTEATSAGPVTTVSRLRVREEDAQKARQLPIVMKRLEDLEQRNAQLESRLAEETHRRCAFQHEAYQLRSMIKMAEHPELVNVASLEAENKVLFARLEEMRAQLREAEEEKRVLQTYCAMASSKAELYGASSRGKPSSRLNVVYTPPRLVNNSSGVVESPEQETARSDSIDASGHSQTPERCDRTGAVRSAADDDQSSTTVATKEKSRQLRVLRCQNNILSGKVSELMESNAAYIERVEALERVIAQLAHSGRGATQALTI